MSENYVLVDDKYYDPYFILEVDQDDELEYIIKAYKTKAKKYHPDKAKTEKDKIKNEKRFKILRKCIEHIKEKRETSFIDTNIRKNEYKNKNYENKIFKNKSELNEFNNTFLEKSYSSNKKINNIKKDKNSHLKELNENEIIINQFNSSKFENDKFNLIFDYNLIKNNKLNNDNSDSKQLIHYTTDGFYGYNTADLQNFAMVKSFNGLLISDDLIDSDSNYNCNYADIEVYNNHVKNPEKLIKLTKKEKENIKKILEKEKSKVKKASNYLYKEIDEIDEIHEIDEIDNINDSNTEDIKYKTQFEKEQYKLYKKNLINLEKQQEQDKSIIINSNIYDKNLIEEAEHQVLDMSPSLLRALDEHYKFKRLT